MFLDFFFVDSFFSRIFFSFGCLSLVVVVVVDIIAMWKQTEPHNIFRYVILGDGWPMGKRNNWIWCY